MKPFMWFEGGLWWVSYSRVGLISFYGRTMMEAWKARQDWLHAKEV